MHLATSCSYALSSNRLTCTEVECKGRSVSTCAHEHAICAASIITSLATSLHSMVVGDATERGCLVPAPGPNRDEHMLNLHPSIHPSPPPPKSADLVHVVVLARVDYCVVFVDLSVKGVEWDGEGAHGQG